MCVQISDLCLAEVEASRHDDLGDQGQVVDCLKRNLMAHQQQTRNLNVRCIKVSSLFCCNCRYLQLFLSAAY